MSAAGVTAAVTADNAALVVRCGLVLLFLPFSALDKVLGFRHAVAQAQKVFKPRALAIFVLLCGLAIEVFMSLGVITGIADRACALVIAGYCAASAVLYKQFWAQGDFWANPDGKGRGLFWDFLCSRWAGLATDMKTRRRNGSSCCRAAGLSKAWTARVSSRGRENFRSVRTRVASKPMVKKGTGPERSATNQRCW